MYTHPIDIEIWARRAKGFSYPRMIEIIEDHVFNGGSLQMSERKNSHSISRFNRQTNQTEVHSMGSCLYAYGWIPLPMEKLHKKYNEECCFPLSRGKVHQRYRESLLAKKAGEDNTRKKALYVKGELLKWVHTTKDFMFESFGPMGIHILAGAEVEVVPNVSWLPETDPDHRIHGSISSSNWARIHGEFMMLDDEQYQEKLIEGII